MPYTFYNPKYERAKVMRTVEFNDNVFYLDIFDPKLVELMRNIKRYKPYQYDITIPLTTVSYKSYMTTTLDWVILMYNGFCHEFEIEDGTVLKVPALSSIGSVFAEATNPSNVGTVVML